MRIMDYPKTTEIVKGSTFLNVDSAAAGTKAIEADDLRKEFMKFTTRSEFYNFLDQINIPLVLRRNIGRGSLLGSVVTDEQKAAIADGSFKGMFIGDYWEKNGIRWRIADMDYWFGKGNPICNTHHVVIVPDSGLGNEHIGYYFAMNGTDTTAGGYLGSQMVSSYISQISSIIYNFVSVNKVLAYYDLFTNSVANGYPSSGAWSEANVVLMNEPMIYGANQMTPASSGTVTSYRYTTSNTQLSLFKLFPEFICASRQSYWLRDICSSAHFACVDSYGNSSKYAASMALSVRPVFGIIG